MCEALADDNCVLEELDISDAAIKAEREAAVAVAMPARLYGIRPHETDRLAALHPAVRPAVLRAIGYPSFF